MDRIPSTSELYLNKTQMIKDLKLRQGLSSLVDESAPDQLQSLVFIITGKRWSQHVIELDLGSTAIETLLDCIEHSDHHQLHDYKTALEVQGIII
jgi:hypothetical protein